MPKFISMSSRVKPDIGIHNSGGAYRDVQRTSNLYKLPVGLLIGVELMGDRLLGLSISVEVIGDKPLGLSISVEVIGDKWVGLLLWDEDEDQCVDLSCDDELCVTNY
ncbi:unnamed protein product [Ambrosiozyma monospora]|uniref:Unnamed protein product n=1 Tax=Ambrosiozyma monospora TaxID=43982 RepID=A0A9W6YTK9_AMBMO|nr:unnamed protein product [Ambrosiozyma monospora]